MRTRLFALLSLVGLMAGSCGCMGIVRHREPKLARRDLAIRPEVAPVIDLDFSCSVGGDYNATRRVCKRQRRALENVRREYDYLSRSSHDGVDPQYRMVISSHWNAEERAGEACGYMLALWIPCIAKDRLVTTAEVLRADGSLVGRAESSADRLFIVHTTGIWLFPVVFPSLPAYARFSTNTYRSLFTQVARILADDVQGATSSRSLGE
jgi:hypothetical protein